METRHWICLIVVVIAFYLILINGQKPQEPTDSRVVSFVGEFDRVWNDSFKYGCATRETVRRLVGIAAQAQDALYSVKAALPSDTKLESAWRKTADAVQADHFAKIQDVRKRAGAPLLFPAPLEDSHYNTWWRAANYYDDDGGGSSPV
jgi:hypothetical protein